MRRAPGDRTLAILKIQHRGERAMDAQRNLRCTSFVIRALLATLCVFVIPKLASSEPDAGTQQRDDAGKSPRALGTPGGGAPMRAWSRLFPNSEGCAAAKLDVWLERGVVTYSIFSQARGSAVSGLPLVSAAARTEPLCCLARRIASSGSLSNKRQQAPASTTRRSIATDGALPLADLNPSVNGARQCVI
jgi:hypothetical protein